MEVEDWLRVLGLERYEEAFRENAITADLLASLTAEDLKDLGITAVGHRRRLLDAVAMLRSHNESAEHLNAHEPDPDLSDDVHDQSARSDGERRQVSVMFCDMADSTKLSTRLDPEDLSAVIRLYQSRVAMIITQFEGFITRYVGDGVLIYFGYPRAHEDDAERAVRAALAVIAEIGQTDALSEQHVRVRIGIATGLVVVGEPIGTGEARQQTAIGETPNLAARLHARAEPNTVVIAASTRRLVGDLFEYCDLGAMEMKGFAGPVPAWQVLCPSVVESRFEALHAAVLSPLVGRDEELDLLRRRWARARSGEGQVVLLSGEPGIGKSRLTAALQETLREEPHIRMRYFCSPHRQDSALWPVIRQLERAAGFARDDRPEAKRDKLLTLLGPRAELNDISLLVDLLSLPNDERFPRLDLIPQQRKQRTFAALMRQLEGLAQQRPVLMIFEDLHWIDPTSRELLDLTLLLIERLPIFLIVTYRPEFSPPWAAQSHVTVMTLNRLGRNDGTAMVLRLSANTTVLPADVVAEIVERTDGVPLFIEEMTKAVLEANTAHRADAVAAVPADSLGVPATLHASLMGRLDRLGPKAKHVAQIGAAIGREFSFELVAALGDLREGPLRETLKRLVEAGLMFEHGTPPAAEYLFKHALVQDAAYGTLLRRTRQQLHARIAATLEDRFADRTAREPEVLAHHHTEAKQPDCALGYWLEAGRRAVERSANLEAIRHLTRALEALRLLPEGSLRDRQELTIQTTIGTPLTAVHGFAAPETGAAFDRARVLGERLKDTSALIPMLSGQHTFYFGRGDYAEMRRMADEARRTAREMDDEVLDMIARRMEGLNALYAGSFKEARNAFETIARIPNPDSHCLFSTHYFHDPKLAALAFLPVTSWILGYPAQAQTWRAAALEYTTEMNKPALAAYVRIYAAAELDVVLLNAPGVRSYANMIVELADQHNLMRYFWLSGQILKGWAMARQGETEAGLALMRRSATDRMATGVHWFQNRYLCSLAETYLLAGRADDGLVASAEAIELMAESGEYMWEAELNRIEGELRRLSGTSLGEVESRLQRALTIARNQNAKGLELRAAMSLARLWRDHDRRGEAYSLLTPVYRWFSEGFDTADLNEAKALLEELA